ncbi:MAG TPA: hypothetical protein VF859_14525, partial [Burkholderiales bacterium]
MALVRHAGLAAAAQADREFAWYMAALLLAAQARTCIRHLAPGMQRLVPARITIARRTLAQERFDPSVA